jgi:hypothetical protein
MLPFRVIQLEQYRTLHENITRLSLPEFRYSELSLIARSSSSPRLLELNRQIQELKRCVTYRKQTTETCSNRQKIQKRWPSISKSTSLSSTRDFAASTSRNMVHPTQKNEGFLAKWAPTSNRNWVKNRTYRKQTTKPCLTGARTHIREFRKSLKTDPIPDIFFAPIPSPKSRGIA